MSYNPSIHDPSLNRQKAATRHNLSPNAGLKHSDIVKATASSSIANNASRVKTTTGFNLPLANSPDFTVRQEHIAGGNNTGLKLNKKGDLHILVQHGTLFVNIKNGENIETTRLLAGQSLYLGRGTVYGIATLANEYAEVLIVESVNYGKTLQVVGPPEAVNDKVVEAARALDQAARIDNSKTMAQAKEIAALRSRRDSGALRRETNATGAVTANSSNVIGVNPKPFIPSEE